MTPSTTSTAESAQGRPSPHQTPSRGHALLVLIFRLLLLGVGGSFALLAGIVLARFYPATVENPPLLERVLRGTAALQTGANSIPQWNRTDQGVAPVALPSTTPTPAGSPAPPAQRQQLQTQVTGLKQELQELSDRLTTVETQLGVAGSGSVEERLQAIEQQLNPGSASSTGQPIASTSTVRNENMLMVTLPSDALFGADGVTLRPETSAILDSIAQDLQQYPGATIQVAAHTDSQGSAADDRARSYAQAKAIEQVLSGKLDEYHWVVVGYGSSQPLARGTTVLDRQRNRRIELIIQPSRS